MCRAKLQYQSMSSDWNFTATEQLDTGAVEVERMERKV